MTRPTETGSDETVAGRKAAPGRTPAGSVFDRALLDADTLDAARALLGAILVREVETAPADEAADETRQPAARRVGRIVEVEAYGGPADHASHARFGSTARSAVMFGPPGIAYVYLVYGMYDALNVVIEPAGSAAAVLVRAVEPLAGVGTMRAARLRRAVERRRAPVVSATWLATERERLGRIATARLASGPGLLAAAFEIDRSFTGVDLCDPTSPLRLEAGSPVRAARIVSGPRVGVGYAAEPWRSAPWRFAIAGHPSVSRPPIAPAQS